MHHCHTLLLLSPTGSANKINFRTRKTMMVAQQLYEGINLGSGAQGLITYMRTDSTRISPVAQNQAAEFITERFGSKYSKHGSKVKNSSAAQDAHEAIRPSNVFQTPESIAKYLDKDQLKLYTLIWNRFVASQMTAAVFDTMKVTLSQNGVIFTANGSQIKFDGYMAVYNDSDKNKMLPDMAEGDTVKKVVTTPEQHFTQPPARYSEATLIKTLEENGVGRPSTYAPTLDVIQRRYYVKLVAKRFEPTELGEIVNSLIVEFFPDIVDVKFTAEMEGKLDKVEIGKEQWQKVIDEFFKPFQKLEKAEEGIEKIQIKDEPAGFDCDLCGHPMVIKLGRYGKFYACSNFPDCHNTKAITKEIGVTCPTCGQGQVIERKTKRNRVSTVVIAILTVNLRRGISLSDVTVLNQVITLSRRRSVVAVSKSSVVTKSVTTKNLLLNKRKLSQVKTWDSFCILSKTDTFLKFVFILRMKERKVSGFDIS